MKFLIPAILTVLILISGQVLGSTEKAELERVIDGDTVEVKGETVRFLGVDTPEISRENNAKEYGLENKNATIDCLNNYGEKASEFVEKSVSDNVTLIYDKESDKRGDYGRKLAYIQSEGDLTRELLVKGLARVYPSDFSRKNEFYFWEYVAKKNERGLWSCS